MGGVGLWDDTRFNYPRPYGSGGGCIDDPRGFDTTILGGVDTPENLR